jgi:hypothetical protein
MVSKNAPENPNSKRIKDFPGCKASIPTPAKNAGSEINNAKRIKVIRGIGADAKVYLFDLSTVESYKKLDFVLRNHDIVYIEPTKGPREVYPTVAPILSIISSFIIVYTVFISRL